MAKPQDGKSRGIGSQKRSTDLRKQRRQKELEYLKQLKQQIEELDINGDFTKFTDLPLSRETQEGLKKSHYTTMTDIQKQSICHALKGADILGAAKTGSGKTLAFLIPVLERLYHEKWTHQDGLGALIISPTRELAVQIFQVLRKIGRFHSFSAGLVIGGKDVKDELSRVARLNILIATPGRLLHHMDQAVGLDWTNLQCLVLDEADRIMDLGFKKTMDEIVKALPRERQTLLFSATQTKSVSDLARLSLVDPLYISTEDSTKSATPVTLEQHYTVVPLDQKLDVLFSFLKAHLKSKILVFFSSSKQVRFAFETFRKLQPGIPLLHLHGRQKQTARIESTSKFSSAQYSCLFATDVVARGLDFPAVDWVVQLDAPEDAATYIHRVGRSARFGKSGKALLVLTPFEEKAMLQRLEARHIKLERLNIKASKMKSIKNQLQALCFSNPELKYLGQKAFISYFRSIYLQKDKEIFRVQDLPAEAYAASLGLPGAPKIKILGDSEKVKEKKNESRKLKKLLQKADSDGEIDETEKNAVKTKYDKMFERKNQGVLSEHYLSMAGSGGLSEKSGQPDGEGEGGDEDEDDFLKVKRVDHVIEEDLPDLTAPVSKRQMKKALSKKAKAASAGQPQKLLFDEEGKPHQIYELEDEEDFKKAGDAEEQIEKFMSKEREGMDKVDVEDKEIARAKRQEKKRKRKEAERLAAGYDDGSDEDSGPVAYLAGASDEEQEEFDAADGSRFSGESGESGDETAPPAKKAKWFQKDVESDGVEEIEEPQTLEDLEALTRKLIRH